MNLKVLPLLSVVLISTLSAQESQESANVRRLTLLDAVKIARSNSFDVQIAAAEKDQVGGDFTKSASVFLPQLSVSETFVSTNDPLNVFGLKLKQERVTAADFDPTVLNSPPSLQNFSTKAELRQPIFNLDGFFGRHAAAKGSEAASFKLTRTRYGAEMQTKMAYFGLVLARQSLGVIRQALLTAEAYRDQAKNFFDQGVIQKSDYLMTGVRVLELEAKKLEAENGERDAERALRYALGLTDEVHVETVDTLRRIPVETPPYRPEEIYGNRSDMLALRSAIDATEAMTNMYRSKFVPSLNAFASYELNNDLPVGTRGRNWMVGALLKWDVFTGFDQVGEIQKASAQHSALEAQYAKTMASAANELRSALQSLQSSVQRIALADATVGQAEEQFRIVSDRYAEGLERTSDLLRSETALSSARLDRLNTLFQHSSSVFLLEFLLEQQLIPGTEND